MKVLQLPNAFGETGKFRPSKGGPAETRRRNTNCKQKRKTKEMKRNPGIKTSHGTKFAENQEVEEEELVSILF